MLEISLCIWKWVFHKDNQFIYFKRFWHWVQKIYYSQVSKRQQEEHIAIRISKDFKILFMASWIFTAVMNCTHSPKSKAENVPLDVRSPDISAIKLASTRCTNKSGFVLCKCVHHDYPGCTSCNPSHKKFKSLLKVFKIWRGRTLK